MRSFGAPSMKRTMILTNQEILTRLGTEAMKPQREGCAATTKRYKGKDGKDRFVGNQQLKQSQTFDSIKAIPSRKGLRETIQQEPKDPKGYFSGMYFPKPSRAMSFRFSWRFVRLWGDFLRLPAVPPLSKHRLHFGGQCGKLSKDLQWPICTSYPETLPRHDLGTPNLAIRSSLVSTGKF